MGAGAVGCYFGGLLARAGHAVQRIGRSAHVEAVRREGLLLETQTLCERVPIGATTGADGVRGAQLVLFCVKSSDTVGAGAQIADYLEPDALVLSLQNGVDNAERLQAGLKQHVAPAVVYVASEMAGPGHVKHHGRGELVIGPDAARDGLISSLSAAGIPVQISDNVLGALWAKLILNCAYNALSAITQLHMGVSRRVAVSKP